MTQMPPPAVAGARPRTARGRGWLAAALCGLWVCEGRLLGRTGTYSSYSAAAHHAHLLVWIAGLLVALCVLPWGPLAVRAAAAVGVSWAVTGRLLAAGQPIPVWGLTESAALLVLLCLVSWRTTVRPAVPLGIALAAGVLAAPVRDADASGTTVVASALVVAGVAALGLCLRYRDAERAQAVAAAREAERLELAGELHDYVAHHVQAMTLLAKATGSLAQDERVAASLRNIQEAGDVAMTTAQRLLKVLQQDHPRREPLPGPDRIAEPVEAYRRAHPDAHVTFDVDPCFGAGLAPELAASVHRIMDEALANVAKHSPGASAVDITLQRSGERLFVSVRDDGDRGAPPRPPEESGGLGLVGITERADAIGGSLTAGPAPGGGWEVLAVLPVQA
ncbi:sensor histidine kinase [Streptoverticillium reticulum]|uniref:sensor histidine kinase n=1 Tax=Streptoverticillium reticulum TaxID=1433415 RepID=UPI0039BF1363